MATLKHSSELKTQMHGTTHKMLFTTLVQNPYLKLSLAWGAKLIKTYFYSYNVETHQKWAHNPFWILTHNLTNQVLGLNFSASLNRLSLTSQ